MAKAKADIRSLARAHTDSAVRTLAKIMAAPKAPAAARVQAAQALLDRGWGRPPQHVEVGGDVTVSHRLAAALDRVRTYDGDRGEG